jgi:hypothetical protein
MINMVVMDYIKYVGGLIILQVIHILCINLIISLERKIMSRIIVRGKSFDVTFQLINNEKALIL